MENNARCPKCNVEFATEGAKTINCPSCNAQLDASGVRKYCVADKAAIDLLGEAYEKLGLSARGHDRIMRLARTIADLAQSELIRAEHIAEAIRLRALDRKYVPD